MSDHQEAKQATPPETLLAELLDSRVPKSEREHVAKREIERLRADLETERMRLVACGVAALANTADSAARARDILPEYRSASLDDVERAVDREIQLRDERDELRDVLLRNGFVPCDIPACNCGSWHARFGLPERMHEINRVLFDAGHPLSNDNGNLAINALRQLVAERDALAKQAEPFRRLVDACKLLSSESEVFEFDDGIGRFVALDYWHEFDDKLDAAINAQLEKERLE